MTNKMKYLKLLALTAIVGLILTSTLVFAADDDLPLPIRAVQNEIITPNESEIAL